MLQSGIIIINNSFLMYCKVGEKTRFIYNLKGEIDDTDNSMLKDIAKVI